MDLVLALLGFVVSLAAVAAGLLLVPAWWCWTALRRRRLRSLLRSRGWPPVILTPALLIYPDTVFRKVPPYEEVLAMPLDQSAPAQQLKAVLHMLAGPGAQWVRL